MELEHPQWPFMDCGQCVWNMVSHHPRQMYAGLDFFEGGEAVAILLAIFSKAKLVRQ